MAFCLQCHHIVVVKNKKIYKCTFNISLTNRGFNKIKMGYSAIVYFGRGASEDITLNVFMAYVEPHLKSRGLEVGDKSAARMEYELHRGVVAAISSTDGTTNNLDVLLDAALRESANTAFAVKTNERQPLVLNGYAVKETDPGKFVGIESGMDIRFALDSAKGNYELLGVYKKKEQASELFKEVYKNIFRPTERKRKGNKRKSN